LTENKRVEQDSRILAESAALIRNGKSEEVTFAPGSPLEFVQRDDTMEALLAKLLAPIKTLDDVMKMQFIALRNMDRKQLNNAIELLLLKKGVLKKPAKCILKIQCGHIFPGKKVMFTKNYKSDERFDGVKNGELGQVKKVHSAKVFELTNGKRISLDLVDSAHVQNGYATTCNKAQGSEWDNIIFWIYQNPNPFFTREFAYVALSRAKKKCTIVGLEDEFHQLCSKKARERNTLLRFYLYLSNCTELAKLNDYQNVQLMKSEDFKLLPMGELAVPVLKEKKGETGTKKKK
jgi:ATP-dependent exoDNAse (exonuclease V) alpha subunit